MPIVQGDNGVTFPFLVDKNKVPDLTGATVEIALSRNNEIITKTATIDDLVTGQCEITLSSTDLPIAGIYEYQWTATFEDGRIYSGHPSYFRVVGNLNNGNTIPPSDGGDITVTVNGGDLG